MKNLFITFVFLLLGVLSASAETITMKSGRMIEGEVIEKTDEYIKVRTKEQLWKIPIKELTPETQGLLNVSSSVNAPTAQIAKSIVRVSQDNSVEPNLSSDQTVNIPINPVMNFNGTTRDNILNLRHYFIQKVPAFVPNNYQPSMAVFGQIQDGKPWWGLLGIAYYGPGEKSILGHSEESRFIANPYLLIGVEESTAHIVNNSSLLAQEFYPKPIKLVWQQDGAWGQVTYDISSFYQKEALYRYTNKQELYLSNYNARDFGFNYFSIDLNLSRNVAGTFDTLVPIIQFIHTGGSCGYSGGCNNKSPTQAELTLQWNALPARIYIKMWKHRVIDPHAKSDMDFIIDLN